MGDSTEEIEAKAKYLEAKKSLIEARWGFLDRVVMRGLIPIAIAIAAPIAAYYFAARADEGVDAVRQTEAAVKRAEVAIAQLEAMTQRLEAMNVVAIVRAHVRSSGAAAARREMEVTSDLAKVRRLVELQMYNELRPRVAGDDQLLRQAITGAIDELVAELLSSVGVRGTGLGLLATEPRYPEQLQRGY